MDSKLLRPILFGVIIAATAVEVTKASFPNNHDDSHRPTFGNGGIPGQPFGNAGNRRPPFGNAGNHRPPFGNAVNHNAGNHGQQLGSAENQRRPLGNGQGHQGNTGGLHFGNGVFYVGNQRPPFGGSINSNNRPGTSGGVRPPSIHTDGQSSVKPSVVATSSTTKTPNNVDVPKINIPPALGNLRESYTAWWRGFQSKLSSCGQSHEPASHSNFRVVGGRFGTIEAWPWMVSLYSVLIKQPLCAGTLVADRWVVTAAHCFNGPFAIPSLWTLHFGKVNSSGSAEYEREQVRTIEQIIINPAYTELNRDGDVVEGDIALIKLDRPVEFTDTTSPLCLVQKPSEDLVAMEPVCKITGYGISNLTDIKQGRNVLHVANVPLMERMTCAALGDYGDKLTENMVCAGREEGGVDTCLGDSGGPLQCKVDGKWQLVGVTSWGVKNYKECGQPEHPGVYTDVSKYTPWVYTHIYIDHISLH